MKQWKIGIVLIADSHLLFYYALHSYFDDCAIVFILNPLLASLSSKKIRMSCSLKTEPASEFTFTGRESGGAESIALPFIDLTANGNKLQQVLLNLSKNSFEVMRE